MPMDLAHKFWKGFVEADLLRRREILEVIVNRFMPIGNIKDKKARREILTVALLSYFEDLVEYMETRDNP